MRRFFRFRTRTLFLIAAINAVLLAYVGFYYRMSGSGMPRAPAQHRFGTTKAEPEDVFPAAEFRQQAGLLIGCYHELGTNPKLYVDIARAIDGRLPVFGLVHSKEQANFGMELLLEKGLRADAVHFIRIPGNTIWVRDYAPYSRRSRDNSILMIDAKYRPPNTKFQPRIKDEEMAHTLADALRLPLRSIPLVLQGGNFLSNGDGAVITTSTTLKANRAFGFTDKQIETILKDHLGVRVLCHVNPLDGEPTGHVDMFAAILAKNIMVVGEIDPAVDAENSWRLDDAAAQFSQITSSLGPMKVYRIPMPPKGGSSWRTYTNVIMANGLLLMPSFSDVDPAVEGRAAEVYRSLLPGWQVKRILCDGLVRKRGQLHCISYNLPAYVPLAGLLELASARPGRN